MKIEELARKPLVEEQEYTRWKESIDSSRYNSHILSLMDCAKKTLADIRKEILYAEQHGTLLSDESECLNKESLDENVGSGIKNYFNAWQAHDSFAFAITKKMQEILRDPVARMQTHAQFLKNDAGIRVYVSQNLPLILNNLRAGIESAAKRVFVPMVDSFEFFLATEAQKAYDSEKNLVDFAEKYTYQDLSLARNEVGRLFKPSARTAHDRIIKKKQQDKINSEKNLDEIVEILGDFPDKILDLHRYIRLSHWAAFEEPKKRYIIEAGIVDYLFRELAFQDVKERMQSHPLIRDKKFCLEINQKDFFDLLGKIE